MHEPGAVAVAERLLSQLARGETAPRETATLGAPAHLARALTFLERGTVEAVRIELEDALERAPLAGVVHFVAAAAFFATRDYARALNEGLTAARLSPKSAGAALRQAVAHASALHWFHDLRMLLEAAPPSLADDPQLALARAQVDQDRVLGDALAAADLETRARRVRDAVTIVSPETVTETLEELITANPDVAGPLVHAGELALWIGDLDRARSYFDSALRLDPGCDPARSGLAMTRTLASSANERARDPEATVARLRRAVDSSPGCVGAWLELGLALAAAGERDAFVRVFRRLDGQAAPLLSDAARELGIPMWRSDELAVNEHIAGGPDVERAVFGHALAMLRGNRSATCTTYFTRDGVLRALPPDGEVAAIHARDDAAVRRTTALVCDLLGVPARSSFVAPERGVSEPTTLTLEEVRHFVEHGWLRLEGCFPPSLAHEWTAAAAARIRAGAGRFVEGDDPTREADPANFDIDDPSTWSWARVDLEGAREFSLPETFPRLWGAVCDLLGGPSRIATTTMTDYFILRLQAGRPWTPPEPTGATWHIDDPSSSTRLDALHLGLLGIVCFSDVEDHGGGTYIAPSSIGHVARKLARNPDGVDFVGERAATEIIQACDDAQSVTGKVGDVILVHPLMLHSPSMNARREIRWMANPAFHLRRPMRFDRPDGDHSPVERVVRRALDLED